MTKKKRKRRKKGDRMTRTEGVPVELITEAQKSYPQLRASIKRRGTGGKIYTCAVPTMTPQQLLDIEMFCVQNGGGGDYEIDVGDVNKPGTALFGFKINVEGEPRVWPNQQQAGPAIGPVPGQPALVQPQYGAPPAAAASAPPQLVWQQVIDPNTQQLTWVQVAAAPSPQAPTHAATGYAPQLPAGGWAPPGQQPRGFARFPDAIATDAWQVERSRGDQLSQQRERERLKADEQLELLRRELADIRSTGERERNDLRVAELERRLTERPTSSIDWSAVATVAGTVFTAYMGAQGQRADAVQREQTKSLEVMTNMMAANKGESPVAQLIALAPVIGPLVKEYMSANNPAKQAGIVKVMGEQVLQQTRVAMDAIKMLSEAGGDKPAWLGVIEEIRIGAEKMAEQFSQSSSPATPWPQQGGLQYAMQQHGQPLPFQQQPDGAHQAEVVNAAPQNAQPVGDAAQQGAGMGPEDIVQGLLAAAQYPACLKTKPWADIAYHVLLEATVNIQPIAEAMVEALVNSERAGQLDPYFGAVMQDPSKIGEVVLAYLPSWQTNRDYCDKVVAAFVRERQAPSIVTPPPAGTEQPTPPAAQTAGAPAQQQEPAAQPVTADPPPGNGDKGPTFIKPPPEATHKGTGKPIETH